MRVDIPIQRTLRVPPQRPAAARIALAIAITGLALALTLLLSNLVETRLVVFTLAVMVSAWYGGWKLGLFATALSLLAGMFFFYPGNQAPVAQRGRLIELVLFLLLALLVCWFNAALRSLQEALMKSEFDFRSLVHNAPVGICRCARDGTILQVNPALLLMLGYASPSELLARNLLTDLYTDRQRSSEMEQNFGSERHFHDLEAEWKHREGKPIVVRLSGRPVAEDAVSSYELVAEDITERRLLEQQFRQAQKMEAIGRLAGGIAHDFNNLLMVISGYTQMLLDEVKGESPLRKAATEIGKAADRAASLTRQLLAFSRKQVLSPKVLDLNALVLDNLKMLPRLIGEDIEVVNIAGSDLGRIKADPGQLAQVILNLTVNARDAMPQGGKIILETANVTLEESYTQKRTSMPAGDYVMLAITDTGSGMDAETQSHIFEPFFTTKGPQGTGLGLSTVYGIVKQSGGFIWVYSEPGQGTTFKIYFPRVSELDLAAVTIVPGKQTAGGKETILLVEDEPTLRELVRRFLERHDYTVLEAEGGRAALDIVAQYTGRIHLLLTDIVMPDMNGRELARRLLRLRPGTPVVYMSGYTERAIHQNGELEPGLAFLQKPFTEQVLTEKVRAVLESRERQPRELETEKGQLQLWAVDRAPRLPVRLPLRYRLPGELRWRQGTTENVSRSGVLFQAEQSLQPRSELEIQLVLPIEIEGIGGAEVLCRGEVVRLVQPKEEEMPPALAARFLEYKLLSRTPPARA
jgi:PAS domain S-box-containing protein